MKKNRLKTALVTGAAGFLGAALARVITEEAPSLKLWAATRRSSPQFGKAIHADLRNPKEAERVIRLCRPDVLFHALGIPAVSSKRDLIAAYLETTWNILRALKTHSPRTILILPSSSTVYGLDTPPRLTEESALGGVTTYGRVKQTQENISLASGLDVRIGRIFNLIGAGCPPHLVVGSWSRQIVAMKRSQENILRVGNWHNERDFIDVQDAARGLLAIAVRGETGRIYNISSGQKTSLKTVAEELQRLSGTKFKIKVQIALKRENDKKTIVGDNQKAKHELKWRPHVSISESLQQTLDSLSS